MLTTILAWKTNELIVAFFLNNVVLFLIIQYTLSYVLSKFGFKNITYFKGLLDLIKNKGDDK